MSGSIRYKGAVLIPYTRFSFFALGILFGILACSSNKVVESRRKLELEADATNGGTSNPSVDNPDHTKGSADKNEPDNEPENEPESNNGNNSAPVPPPDNSSCIKKMDVPPTKKELLCYNSVSAALAALPNMMLDYHVLMHESQSNQPSATLAEPRIILYSPDGRTLMGVTSAKGDPNREMLEVAKMNMSTGLWDFFSIDYSKPEGQKLNGNDVCKACHGPTEKQLRPIWANYPKWPGAYSASDKGEIDCPQNDILSLSSEMAKNLTTIYKNKNSSDRFAHIRLAKPRNGNNYEKCEVMQVPENAYRTINIVFVEILSHAQASSIVRRIANANNYDQMRKKLLLSSDLCSGTPAANNARSDIESFVNKHYSQRYPGQSQRLNSFEKLHEIAGVDVRSLYLIDLPFTEENPKNCESC